MSRIVSLLPSQVPANGTPFVSTPHSGQIKVNVLRGLSAFRAVAMKVFFSFGARTTSFGITPAFGTSEPIETTTARESPS
ncbi:MAG TPA: hypothetical protein VLU46_04955 [Thermoanaerobaculia bacterium]|nr:hypothetical protein [Thermoanaerobaculia bacterium]